MERAGEIINCQKFGHHLPSHCKIPIDSLFNFQFLKTLPVPQFSILNTQIFSTYKLWPALSISDTCRVLMSGFQLPQERLWKGSLCTVVQSNKEKSTVCTKFDKALITNIVLNMATSGMAGQYGNMWARIVAQTPGCQHCCSSSSWRGYPI